MHKTQELTLSTSSTSSGRSPRCTGGCSWPCPGSRGRRTCRVGQSSQGRKGHGGVNSKGRRKGTRNNEKRGGHLGKICGEGGR